MRAPAQEPTATAGQSEVAAKFERLNWGVAPNAYHDLGTDLWLMARDERRFDLGMLVGAQVKAGPSYFEDELVYDDTLQGWWYYESDRRHFDAWLAHTVPHLLVLHDLETSTSYWVHVTSTAVRSTGQGAKIFVPRTNLIDDAHFAALTAVATSGRRPSVWEGSAWTGAAVLAPKDRLRHALIAPRLLAPHRNAGFDHEPRPDQVLALLAQARLDDANRFAARHDQVPTLEDATGSADWSWRFVGAFAARASAGEVDPLVAALRDAPGGAERAAAAVAAAAINLDVGAADAAIKILETARTRDDAEPVDHAWMSAQLARAYAEIGRVQEARQLALEVLLVRTTHPDDVTAAAIAAAAAALIFTTADLRAIEVGEFIQASDTTASWWRTQSLAWGLSSALDVSYRAWSNDRATHWGVRGNGHGELWSAACVATHACDHMGWQQAVVQLAKNDLTEVTRTTSVDEVSSALTSLLHAGDSKVLGLAIDHIVADGPAAAAAAVAAGIDLAAMTHGTAQASLVVLARAGDVLDPVVADRTVDWLLRTLADPTEFNRRTWPRYDLQYQLQQTLRGVLGAASAQTQVRVLDMILGLPPRTDQVSANRWAAVLRAVPASAWTADRAAAAAARASSDHWELRQPLLGAAARLDASAAALLRDEASSGSLSVLPEIEDVAALPIDVARTLIDLVADAATNATNLARTSSGHTVGSINLAQALVVLNISHPALARWDELLESLAEPAVRGDEKDRALWSLAAAADRLPPDVAGRLAEIAAQIVGRPERLTRWAVDQDIDERLGAAALQAAIVPDVPQVNLTPFLADSPTSRMAAARLAGRLRSPAHIGILTVLVTDDAPRVRAMAAASLAAIAVDDPENRSALDVLVVALADLGTAVPVAVAATLASADSLPTQVVEVIAPLRVHPSAKVRASITRALGPDSKP